MVDAAQIVPKPRPVGETTAIKRPGALRYFLVALSLYYVVVAVVGFTPSYVDFLAGNFPIDPIVHVHGALMASWLGVLVAQTYLAASGSIAQHRALGLAATGLAGLVWISMWVMTIHALQHANFPQDDFLIDVMLAQLDVMVLFPLFFIWGFLARRRPESHRRLMILATIVLLQASVDRMSWIPDFGWLSSPGIWSHGVARLYPLALAPLFIFDMLSIKRIHPVTMIGTLLIVVGHLVMGLLWGSAFWHALAAPAVALVR